MCIEKPTNQGGIRTAYLTPVLFWQLLKYYSPVVAEGKTFALKVEYPRKNIGVISIGDRP